MTQHRASESAETDQYEVAFRLREVVAHSQLGETVGTDGLARHRAVLACRDAIEGIFERLVDRRAPPPDGIARAAVLADQLEFGHTDAGTLLDLLWWVADALRLCPPHDWACPVVNKLEPELTTWTCRRCGALVNR